MVTVTQFEAADGREFEFVVDIEESDAGFVSISVQTAKDGDPVLPQQQLTVEQARELGVNLLEATSAQEFLTRVQR